MSCCHSSPFAQQLSPMAAVAVLAATAVVVAVATAANASRAASPSTHVSSLANEILLVSAASSPHLASCPQSLSTWDSFQSIDLYRIHATWLRLLDAPLELRQFDRWPPLKRQPKRIQSRSCASGIVWVPAAHAEPDVPYNCFLVHDRQSHKCVHRS